MDNKNILIVTVGLPRSGKTTWAKEFANKMRATIVNPDSFRLELNGKAFLHQAERLIWANIHLAVPSLFRSGNDLIIIDATNVTRKRRTEWKDDRWTTFYKIIDTSAKDCIERAHSDGRVDLIPVIERMAKQWEPLGSDELEFKIKS